MVNQIRFEQLFQDLCDKHQVRLFLHDPKVEKNNGYAQFNEIHLGNKYKNMHIYMAVAFHELGHAIINLKRSNGIKRYNVNSCFFEEWSAWDLAQRLYSKTFKKPFTKSMGNFILKCLKTHSSTHYAFKDIFGDEITMK